MSSDEQRRDDKESSAVYGTVNAIQDDIPSQEDGMDSSSCLLGVTSLTAPSDCIKVISGKSNYQRRAKPPFSYIALIAMAIQESQSQKLTLAEINDYLMKKFPFFRGEYTGWRNSVRHNLSLNECFQKVLRDPSRPWGKDNYWMLNESSDYTFADGVFRRRRKRLHKKSKGKHHAVAVADGAAGKAAAVMMMNNFNPEHKHDVAKNRQSSSFLIDDLLGRERGTSEAENATAQEVPSSRHKSATVLPNHHTNTAGRRNTPATQKHLARSPCEEEVCTSTPSATYTRQSKPSKDAVAASSSTADHQPIIGRRHHHHHHHQHDNRHTHSSSPLRSPSVSSSSQAAVSSSTITTTATTTTGTWKGKLCADSVNSSGQDDGCVDKQTYWRKHDIQGEKMAKPQSMRFQTAAQTGLPYPFCWPISVAGGGMGYLSPHHHQAVMAAHQQFNCRTTYPFTANTFAANLYPFLSPQQALQMSSVYSFQ